MCVTLKLPSFRFSGFTLFFSFSDSLDASAQVILILIPKVITHFVFSHNFSFHTWQCIWTKSKACERKIDADALHLKLVTCSSNYLEKDRQPTSVFLPEESHGQRSLVGNSPWGHKRAGHD